ncbi:unnamed protein product [Cylindrotheca closterium]|uniref:Uncharacterized protein n=1 Tax=Cylindrotheca closterium TaxID=2856 RepID=A0AAD2CFR0_9STRA|nr:unnamed protein product [Cylindrotheca closterium]
MKIQSIVLVLVLSTYAVAAKRLREQAAVNEHDRQLQEKNPNKRINWGDGLDNIGDGGFLDDIKDGFDDLLENITDAFDGNNLGDGIGDLIGDFTDGFEWPESWPKLNDGKVDWENFTNWINFDFNNFTWDLIDWDSSTWDDFRGDIDLNNPDIDFCSILETAVGIGKGFGIEGNCRCKDNGDGDIAIGCDFQNECYSSSALCGEVNLNYTMSDEIAVSACVDFEGDSYPEVCFDYAYNMSGQGAHTCSASYGGNTCECALDGFCLSLDCSMFLPGAAFDSCQLLETVTEGDIISWLPEFPAFGDNFSQVFDNIDWDVIDWGNLDTDNFNPGEIEWGSNARERRFGDIINVNPADDLMCPILQSFIGMSTEFNSAGGCSCGASDGEEQGLSMDCKFENACVDEKTCASIGVSFEFVKLGGVQTEACVNFADDGHPETCFAFEVDVAETSAPTCFATYGGKECKCSIENLCLAVDCSEYEPTAVVDTCQQIDFGRMDPISFIPRFAERRDASDIQNDGNGDSTSKNREAESSATVRATIFASLLVLLPLLL